MGKKKATKPVGAKMQPPEFQGSIVRSPFDALTAAAGVTGANQVWFPKSKADVATAVALTKDQRTLVRSGMQAAATDATDAGGGVVIHLAALKDVSVKNGVVNAEAGSTTETVARHLSENGLALPLADSPQKSIASNVLDDGPSCLIRTLGPLSDYVSRLGGVTPAGQPVTRSGAGAVAQARADNVVITGVTFKPARANNLWMLRKSFPYPGNERFEALAKALFSNPQIPARADVVLDAISTRYDMPIVRLTAAGSSPKTKTAVTKLVEAALAGLPAAFVTEIVTESHSGADVVRSIVDAGPGVPLDPDVDAHRVRRVVEPEVSRTEFLASVTDDVDRGLAFRDDGTGKRDENLRLFTRLQIDREDRLVLSGLLFTPRPVAATPPARLASVALLDRAETPLHAGRIFGPLVAPRIPGFKGTVYIPSDLLYEWNATQYATSSYPPADMTPFMVAFPRDAADIRAALAFARGKQKRVVARSGGHQYCGMSSGGSGTIVLAMDAFAQLNKVADNVYDVGPAVRLTELASFFKDQRVTIPHGECPRVCIGGHAQTGGFGHLLRGSGLTLDCVTALTIVLADGSVRTVRRPAGPPVTADDELFWGVLGGNAGSFGIVTNYRFECIRDADHPHSYGYARLQKYEKGCYKSLMKQVQVWTQGVVAGTLLPDIDFMMTVESRSELFLPPVPVILVEMVHSNLGGAGEVVNGDQVFQPIIRAAEAGESIWAFQRLRGTKPLSTLSNFFVRRPRRRRWTGASSGSPTRSGSTAPPARCRTSSSMGLRSWSIRS